jgi:hypothetical protein
LVLLSNGIETTTLQQPTSANNRSQFNFHQHPVVVFLERLCYFSRPLQTVYLKMRLSRQDAVHVMAGAFILISLALYYWVSVWFLIVPTFVGANLFQYGLTGMCPAEMIFAKLGFEDAKCPITKATEMVAKAATPTTVVAGEQTV